MGDVDTKIRRITRAGTNVFEELKVPEPQAKILHETVQREIAMRLQLKAKLMNELSDWMLQTHLKQAEAAKLLMISRPRVSDVVNKKAAKFSIDTLLEMLSRAGKRIEITVR